MVTGLSLKMLYVLGRGAVGGDQIKSFRRIAFLYLRISESRWFISFFNSLVIKGDDFLLTFFCSVGAWVFNKFLRKVFSSDQALVASFVA